MIEFGGVVYYMDLAALDNSITLDKKWNTKISSKKENHVVFDDKGAVVNSETIESIEPKTKEIDGPKYDILRMCIETILDYSNETDDALGIDRAMNKAPLSYKLSFNTLVKEGILKEE